MSTLGSGRQPGQRLFHRREKPEERTWRHWHQRRVERLGRRAPDVVAPAPDVVAPAPDVGAPAPDVVAPAPDVVAPAPDVVAPAPDVVAPAPDVVAPAPDVVAPVSDVIVLVQDVLTSVAGTVVPLTQLQSEFYSFLLGIAGVEPVVDAWGRIDSAALSAAIHAWVASHLPLVLELAGIPGVPLAGNAAWFATLGGTAPATFCAATQVCRASSLPGMAHPFFRPASSELLLPGSLAGLAGVALPGVAGLAIPTATRVLPGSLTGLAGVAPPGVAGLAILTATGVLPLSLAALAAAALPGVGGLVGLTAAGVRIGHRQAKAGYVLRTSSIARFAHRPGSLGTVRSGSLVVARPRALRVVRPGALSAGCLLEKVAA